MAANQISRVPVSERATARRPFSIHICAPQSPPISNRPASASFGKPWRHRISDAGAQVFKRAEPVNSMLVKTFNETEETGPARAAH